MTNNLKAERTLTAEELQAIIANMDGGKSKLYAHRLRPEFISAMANLALRYLEVSKHEGDFDFEEASEKAWTFVKDTLLERGREKGYAGVWGDGFRQGWESAERALRSQSLSTQQPMGEVTDGMVTRALKAHGSEMFAGPIERDAMRAALTAAIRLNQESGDE